MEISAILFAIAAGSGSIMAQMRFQGRDRPPLRLVLLHGAFATAGFVALLLLGVNVAGTPAAARGALTGFAVTAFGGFILFLQFHLRKIPIPIRVVLVHGFVALMSFVTLLEAIKLKS